MVVCIIISSVTVSNTTMPPGLSSQLSLTSTQSSVRLSSWSTKPVPMNLGVYQGDPLSVIIFNTVMSTLADSLKAHEHLGYSLSGSKVRTNILLYADDTCLVANGPASCQHLLSQMERWLQWTGMTAKVSKCFTLGIQPSTAKRIDPHLHLQNENIPFIGDRSIRFLGGPIQVPSYTNQHRHQLQHKLQSLLEKVDSSFISRKQKLLLYKVGVCPRLNWDLAIMDLPITWLTSSLEAITTRYLKRWSGLAKSANTARLYLPMSDGGLGLPPLSLLYKKLKVSQAILLLTSRDRVTAEVTHRALKREEKLSRLNFRPVTYSRDIMAEDPGGRRKTLIRKVKGSISAEDATTRREKAESLPLQGQMLRSSNLAADVIWARAVSSLPSETQKFALNSATDTLPHNNNLARWYNGLHSGLCKLCGNKQTLLHILNNCEVALRLRRYNKRHDRILDLINLPATFHFTVDLTDHTYRFPCHITITTLRPDLVLWSDSSRQLYIVELTICYETGFTEAAERKMRRYLDMAEDAQRQGYHAKIIPIQMGSRGVVQDTGLEELRGCLKPISQRTWQAFLTKLASATIEESHRIWCDRNKTG